jgi:hypothetical protein
MPLSQKGAGYQNRDYVREKDMFLADALDDIASQVQAVVTQGNFAKGGVPSPPSAPTALSVQFKAGTFTATISHANAPVGTEWHLQYSTSPQFTSPIDVGLLHPVFQAYLPNQLLFWRVAAKFPSSANSPWVYFGSSALPTGAGGSSATVQGTS